MKIIIIGASGTLGKKITAFLEPDHEIIKVGSKSGNINTDINSPAAIEAMYKQAGPFDAVISATGSGHFGPLKTMTDADFRKGIDSKLLGQINLVLIGQHYIRPKGSFTLTTGILNGAIEAFVRAAAIELENGIRINVVSPNVVEDSPSFFPYFPGHIPVSMDRVVNAYVKSVLGAQTGQVIKVH